MENVVIKFVADTEGLKPAIEQLAIMGKLSDEDKKKIAEMNEQQKQYLQTLNRTTTEAGKLNTEIEDMSKTMSQKVINDATEQLEKFTDESKKATEGAKSLKAELRELKKQIASGNFTGKELEQMTKRAAELEDHLGDVNDKIRALASDTKYIDAMAGAMKGVAAATAVAAGASALFGTENKKLAEAAQKAQAAMTLLAGVQELATLVTEQNAVKTLFLDGAQKLATASSRVLGVTISTSMAAATMGLSLVVGAIVALMVSMDDAEDTASRVTGTAKDRYENLNKEVISLAESRIKRKKDSLEKELELEKFYDSEARAKIREQHRNQEIDDATFKLMMLNQEEQYRSNVAEVTQKWREKEKAARDKANEETAKKSKELKDKEIKDLEDYRKKREAIYVDLADSAKQMEVSVAEDSINARKKDQEDRDKAFADRLAKQKKANDAILTEEERLAAQKKRLDEEEKKRKEDLQQAAIDSAQSISNALFEITNRDINARYETEIAAIDERTAKILENENLTAEQRKRIEAKAAADIAKIKTEQFKRQKQADIIQAVINTALAVSRLVGNPIAAAAAGIAGAAQIAVIASQPIPKFAKGTEKFIAEGTGTADRGLAWLSHGERVVPSAVNNDYFDALSAIQNRAVDPTLANNIMMALSNGTMAAAQGDKLDVNKLVKALQGTNKQTTVNINIDEHGFMKFVQKGNSHREYVNKKFKYEA